MQSFPSLTNPDVSRLSTLLYKETTDYMYYDWNMFVCISLRLPAFQRFITHSRRATHSNEKYSYVSLENGPLCLYFFSTFYYLYF